MKIEDNEKKGMGYGRINWKRLPEDDLKVAETNEEFAD